MANEKKINSRIVHKHDTEVNWNKATNFVPLKGEIIIYDIDSTHNEARIKIGNGSTTVINLPFSAETPVRGTDYWTDADKAEIKSYVDEAILGGVW